MKDTNYFVKEISSKKNLIIGVVIIILSVLLGVVSYFVVRNPEAIFLDKVEGDYEYAKVEVALLDRYFASEKTDSVEKKYYLAYDKHNRPYVVVLDEENYNLLKEIQDYSLSDEEKDAPTPVIIYGDSQSIPDEAYQYLHEFINTGEDEDVSMEDMKNAVGKYYLNTYYNPHEDIMFVMVFWSIFIFFGLVLVISYFIRIAKLKKTLVKDREIIDKISQDLEMNSGTHNKRCKIFMNNNYIVSYHNEIKIIDIKNIIWLYPFEIRQNGIVTNKTIYVITNEGKSNIFVSINTLSKKNKIAFEEVYQELMNRTPNALHGYSKENQEKAKEMYKR